MNPTAVSDRFGFIEHLRGAAALAVTVFHAFGSSYEATLWAPLQPFAAAAQHGWQGVHVFFVLSGFCIAVKISSLARKHRGAGAFLRDRFWRIYPVYWAAALLGLGVALASLPFNKLPLTETLSPHPLVWLGDVTLLQPWLQTPAILLVSWTLSCEVAFYAIAALLLAVRPRIGSNGVLAAGSVLMTLCCAIPAKYLCMPFMFWPEFWLGFLAHASIERKLGGWPALLLVGIGVLGYFSPGASEGSLHLVAIATAAALVLLYQHDAALVGWRPLRWLGHVGLWSYSLYLVHVPLLSRMINLGRRQIADESPWFAVLIASSLAVTLFFAWSFHRIVEAPLERWRRKPALTFSRA